MADKRISDLEATTTLEDTTVFHIRKTETNEDFKITKSNLVKQIGNSVVSGFTATSPLANRLLLTPSNSGSLDRYYDGMTIKFISPIDSTDLVKIKIGSLDYIDFKTTFRNPTTDEVESGVLKTGKFYEAIYSLNSIYSNNCFIQTNIDRQYTNEYLSSAEIWFDEDGDFTLYSLISATAHYKTSYYKGMSVVFTSGIINNSVEDMSTGKVYIDVDGLGHRLLSDPDGDGVPFSLQPNETILAIYDGEKFIKNMFTMQEPELPAPVDPDNPPPGYDITVYVGPNEPEVSNRLLQTAYDRIIQDYGLDGGGRKVLIKFRDNYTGEGLIVKVFVASFGAYITIEGNANVIMLPTVKKRIFSWMKNAWNGPNGVLNLTGAWKCRFPQNAGNISKEYCFIENQMIVSIKDAVIENENTGNQNFYFYRTGPRIGTITGEVFLENVELKNFGAINTFDDDPDYPDDRGGNYFFTNVVLTNTITQPRIFTEIFFEIIGNASIDGLQINITQLSNYDNPNEAGLIKFNGSSRQVYTINLKNCNIILNQVLNQMPIIYIKDLPYGPKYNLNITFENCVIKYNSTLSNMKQSIFYISKNISQIVNNLGQLTILGNDFANKNSGTIPDILINRAKLLIRSNTTIGSTSAINGGIITVIQ